MSGLSSPERASPTVQPPEEKTSNLTGRGRYTTDWNMPGSCSPPCCAAASGRAHREPDTARRSSVWVNVLTG
jgi:hypothetical protein